MRGLLKFLLPKKVNVPPKEPRIIANVRPAPSPSPELDEKLRVERGKFMQEVVKLEDTAEDIRMALSRKTLEFRTRPN